MSYLMRSRMASARGLSSPPSWTYHPLESSCKQKVEDNLLRLLCSSSKISCYSDSVGLRGSHSSMLSSVGFTLFSLHLFICSVIAGHLQFQKMLRETDVFGFKALFACFHAKGTSHISFAAVGRTCEKDIPMLRDILTDCKTLDQHPVQLAIGCIVDI